MCAEARNGATGGPGARVIVIALFLAVVTWLAAQWADRRDRALHVRVECAGEACSASVNHGEPLRMVTPIRGDRAGFYYYHKPDTASQYIRDLILQPGGPDGEPFELPLTQSEDLQRIEGDSGWRIDPRRGLTHEAPDRLRAYAMLEPRVPADFIMESWLVSSVDAGFLLRADDAGNGMLLVVRTVYNDAFFCEIRDWQVGKVLAITPLAELRAGRELLRLGGLIAQILIGATIVLGLLRLIVRRVPFPSFEIPRFERWAARDRAPAWCLILLFGTTWAGAALIAWYGTGTVPHINDEAAYLFQAKIFAQGKLWAPPPEPLEFFEHEHMIVAGDRWFAKYPPMFPLLLAAGAVFGVPWLINPLLAAATGLVTYFLFRELTTWRLGVVAWLLALTSPFFMILGGTFMSHMPAALAMTSAMWLAVRAVRRSSQVDTALCALCIGCGVFIRPFTALMVAMAIGAYYLFHWFRGKDRRAWTRHLVILISLVAASAALFLAWNVYLSAPAGGTANLYTSYHDDDWLGFGPDKGKGWRMAWGTWGHTPAKGLRAIYRFVESMSTHFLGWPGGLSLVFVFAAFFWGWRRSSFWMMLACLALLVIGHWFYWAALHIAYGARYWFASAPSLLGLSAIGLSWTLDMPPIGGVAGDRRAPGRIPALALVGALMLWNFAVYFPKRLKELPSYAGVTAGLKHEVESRALGRSVIFVWTEETIYNEGFFLNDPFMRQDLVFAVDLGPRNYELLAKYPGFSAYRWTRDKELVPL